MGGVTTPVLSSSHTLLRIEIKKSWSVIVLYGKKLNANETASVTLVLNKRISQIIFILEPILPSEQMQ